MKRGEGREIKKGEDQGEEEDGWMVCFEWK